MRAKCTNLRRWLLSAVPLLLGGCASETLFQSNFDGTPVGQPPAHMQQVGTADVFGGPGQVVVVSGPGGAAGKWVQIGRPSADSPIAGMVGNLTAIRGPGRYVFTGIFYMPTGAGLASINFEIPTPVQQGLETFLHLDLTTNNNVRIDDNNNITSAAFRATSHSLLRLLLTRRSPRQRRTSYYRAPVPLVFSTIRPNQYSNRQASNLVT